MTLAQRVNLVFYDKDEFTLGDAYEAMADKPKTTVRARIYDNIGKLFERVSEGVYRCLRISDSCLAIEGDGRDLSFLEDESIDCILTDHPWLADKSHKGGNRNFTPYECFRYTLEDFMEKARVLKPGSFLVEILPAENEDNYEYLYAIKQMAKKAGFLYYSKVPWKKGVFVSNTGRKSKNTEEVMIFSKGKARNLRLDKKKSNKTGKAEYMSGAAGMLPTEFDVNPVKRANIIQASEKPVALLERILNFVTLAGEVVLDSFAGSGSLGIAALNTNRFCILIEKAKERYDALVNRLKEHANNINNAFATKE